MDGDERRKPTEPKALTTTLDLRRGKNELEMADYWWVAKVSTPKHFRPFRRTPEKLLIRSRIVHPVSRAKPGLSHPPSCNTNVAAGSPVPPSAQRHSAKA
jgi:hypothetical protein